MVAPRRSGALADAPAAPAKPHGIPASPAAALAAALRAPLAAALLVVLTALAAAPGARAQVRDPLGAQPDESERPLLSKVVEDSVMELLSQGQTLLIRETNPHAGPPRDHPQAWQLFLDALACMLRSVGDPALDDRRGPALLAEHGFRMNILRPRPGGYPCLVTLNNGIRADEAAAYLLDFRDWHYRTQRLPSPKGCWIGQGVRCWSEGGRDYAAVCMLGLGEDIVPTWLQRLRLEGEAWAPYDTRELGTPGNRTAVSMSGPRGVFPRLEVVEAEPSRLFLSPPAQFVVLLRTEYEVHADSLMVASRSLNPSYFGPATWVMEALVRGHREWADPYVQRPATLDSLARLPWSQATTGWALERYSQHFDTVVTSHAAVGRLRLYSARDGNRRVLTGYEREPAKAPVQDAPTGKVDR
ncbi:MAG TPA: hypothetical protein VMS93_02465 [Candidatus Saccharimonadales bacterium]|nr:hypothetical protein [Candidatus Saccharimonadales bacterium]